jgi:hypothetical protein
MAQRYDFEMEFGARSQRNNSTIGPVAWSGTSRTFMVTHASGSTGLQLMIPSRRSLRLTSLTLNGVSTAFTQQTIRRSRTLRDAGRRPEQGDLRAVIAKTSGSSA